MLRRVMTAFSMHAIRDRAKTITFRCLADPIVTPLFQSADNVHTFRVCAGRACLDSERKRTGQRCLMHNSVVLFTMIRRSSINATIERSSNVATACMDMSVRMLTP
jgi:hypothetical protein